MEKSKWECKILCLPKPQDDPIRLNPSKITAKENAILKISNRSDIHVYAKVTAFEKDLKNHGLSMDIDMTKVFKFQSNEEVVVEVVSKEECEVHMIEVTCADQYVSRGDMWRFKEHIKNTCTYRKKHMDYSGVTVQVLVLYNAKGEEMESGYISEKTHITYRSLSSYTQIFIQIGREMWENDYEGVESWENFEKVVYKFVKTLFDKWECNKANHDLQIIFFTRLFFELNKYPEYKEHMIQFDSDNRPFLDIYDVVCDGGNITDVKPIQALMKRRFNKLGLIIRDLKESYAVEVSGSANGSFLECINLALDQYTNHFQDRVHYRTGQQIVVVTAGSGLFYVNRALASFTKHRILDMGVGVDVVCLGCKPLHATPLFVFNQTSQRKTQERIFDKYQVPHWMNMHFYKIYDNQHRFVPIMGLSMDKNRGEKIIPFRNAGTSFHTNLANCTMKQLNQMCDEYDANLLKSPTIHPCSVSHLEISRYKISPSPSDDNTGNSFSSDAEIHSNSHSGTNPLDRRKPRDSESRGRPESNPFKPASLPRPTTNNRRRWAHVFPNNPIFQGSWPGLSRSLRIDEDGSTLEVDWQSLISPACFPVTTDYHHDMRSLEKEWREHPYSLTSGDIKQLQKEIIIQRLSRGFQIVLKDNQDKNTVTLSMGDTYHVIKLLDNYTNSGQGETINVKIRKPEKKANFPESQKIYKYCLLPYLGKLNDVDESLLNCQAQRATREAMVDAKWNHFDMYILLLMDPDLGEETRPDEVSNVSQLKPWRSRYVFLPRPDSYFPDHNVNTLLLKEKLITVHFYNILFAINSIKPQEIDGSDSKKFTLNVGSVFSSAPNSPSFVEDGFRPRTNTLVDGKHFSFSNGSSEEDINRGESERDPGKGSSVFDKLFKKTRSMDSTIETPDLRDFRETMLAPNGGMKFISVSHKSGLPGGVHYPNLPPHCFLGYNLVDFVRRSRDEVVSYKDAIDFCQELLKQGVIEETNMFCAPSDEIAPEFVDGFYFYHMKPDKPPRDRSVPKILIEVATIEEPARIEHFVPISETDIDIQCPQKAPERKEYLTVYYDSCYHPQHAFELTVEWDVATPQLIETSYLNKWRMKAEKSGFQLVQVPLSPFDSPEMGQTPPVMPPSVAPFRAPIDIPVPCDDETSIEDMLFHFGFLHHFPAGKFASDKIAELAHRRRDYVHLSGIALVRVCIGGAGTVLKWASNAYLGSKKWHPKIFLPGNKKEERFYQMSFEDLLNRFRQHIKDYFIFEHEQVTPTS